MIEKSRIQVPVILHLLFVFYIYIRKIKNKNTKKIQEKVGGTVSVKNGCKEKNGRMEQKKQK